MNLIHDGLKVENFSAEVQAKYAFPAENALRAYLQQEQDGSREHRNALAKKSVVNIATITGGFAVGTLSYMLYNLHAGKVIRDRVRAALPFPQRIFAVALPFLGFATALVVARRSHDVPNGYRN